MTAVARKRESARKPPAAYIRPEQSGRRVDFSAILHRRRKRAMASLLSEFDEHVRPLIAATAESEQAIENFKRSCREKLNQITFEAVELHELPPDQDLNELAVDLLAELQSDDKEGTE